MIDSPPAAFGRYRVVATLGAGAMGTVYLAHDPLIDRQVAVKAIRMAALPAAERAAYRDRFQSEARAGGRCQHPGLVAIHDAGEVDGIPYLVMEYVDGISLQAALAEPSRQRALDPIGVSLELLEALGCAHAHGIVHRDVKPANVLLPRAGPAKIADFGIARLDLGQATAAGDMLGTPSYMAPEQARGEAIDHRADLFSVACVLHAILTGRSPFAGVNLADTLRRLTDTAEADLSGLAAACHADLAAVLRRGLAKAPSARFGSAAEFAAALRSCGLDGATRLARSPAPAAVDGGAVPPAVVDAAAARLATYIGPIAQLSAARAARRTLTVAAFHAALADAISDPGDARRFLREVGQGAAYRVATSPGTTQRPAAAATHGIAADTLAVLSASLAAHLGPVADTLIRRSLPHAATLDELLVALAAEVKDPAAAEAFRTAVYAALQLPG